MQSFTWWSLNKTGSREYSVIYNDTLSYIVSLEIYAFILNIYYGLIVSDILSKCLGTFEITVIFGGTGMSWPWHLPK